MTAYPTRRPCNETMLIESDPNFVGGDTDERERERRPAACFALHRQVPAHEPLEPAADREPQPRALGRSRQADVELHEWLENPLQRVRRNADARIGHAQSHHVRL